MKPQKIYVVTGPESSGKTTLVDALAKYYGIDSVPEYSRIYLNSRGAAYSFDEVLIMAKGQVVLENEFLQRDHDFCICDTDLLTYKIWLNYKYGVENKYVEEKISAYSNRYYFLSSPDFEWESDVLRENPDEQWEIFELYKENLLFYGFDFTILEGDKKLRITDAISIIGEKSK